MLTGLVCVAVATGAVAETIDVTGLPSIEVTGTAEATLAPDHVVWSATAEAENPDLAVATGEMQRKLETALDLVKELGVAPKDVQTGYMNAERVYNRDERGNQTTFRHFRVRRNLTIRMRDFAQFDAMLTGLLADAGLTASYRFGSEDEEDVRWETRIKAAELARRKAEAMAEAAGAKVRAGALRISEHDPSGSPHLGFASNAMVPASLPSMPDASTGTLAPGEITVRVTVWATFELLWRPGWGG
jgi:hypothetical protein